MQDELGGGRHLKRCETPSEVGQGAGLADGAAAASPNTSAQGVSSPHSVLNEQNGNSKTLSLPAEDKVDLGLGTRSNADLSNAGHDDVEASPRFTPVGDDAAANQASRKPSWGEQLFETDGRASSHFVTHSSTQIDRERSSAAAGDSPRTPTYRDEQEAQTQAQHAAPYSSHSERASSRASSRKEESPASLSRTGPAVQLHLQDSLTDSESSDDVDEAALSRDTLSLREMTRGRESPSYRSSSPRTAPSGGLLTSQRSSSSPHNYKRYKESANSASGTFSTSAASSQHGSPLLNRADASEDGVVSESLLPNERSKTSEANKAFPLDKLDQLLASETPTHSIAKSANGRLPLRLGLLSFDEQADDDTEHINGTINGGGRGAWGDNEPYKKNNGVRTYENRARELETENMELRLKLQQYREMNASEQEITRVKWQVDRAERRIDELELALERKNRTIMELSEERDFLASKLRPEHEIEDLQITISELQTAITELESQSLAAEKAEQATTDSISKVHDLMPTIIGADATVDDLVSALTKLHSDNERLAAAEHLCQKLSQMLGEAGRADPEPLANVELLIRENVELSDEAASLKATLQHERKQRNRDIETLKELQLQQADSFHFAEEKLKQQLAKAQAAQSGLQEKLNELEEVVENQHRIISDTRADSYSLVRRFFSELIEVLGAEFQTSVEAELQSVIERAQTQGVSKLPLLTELMLRYTREVAEEAVRSYTAPAVDLKVRAMEQEVQSLEHMLSLKLDKSGADAILLAQNRDLRRALKLEQEKRKTDWNEYTKTVAAIR